MIGKWGVTPPVLSHIWLQKPRNFGRATIFADFGDKTAAAYYQKFIFDIRLFWESHFMPCKNVPENNIS